MTKHHKTTFKTFKSFFFENEIDRVRKLEQKVHKLSFKFHTLEEVREKLKPLLDDALLQALQHKDTTGIQVLAEHLALIIEKSTAHDFPKLSQSLQDVISESMAKNIEKNKDKMVDAMYPIMGALISKYVSNAIQEMMENINHKIEEGLSFDRYKRKMKAKVSGVSEAELLMEESNEALIRSLFIIHKQTSLLICEEHLKDEAIADPHMVASMASAIKDFVNDWIVNHEVHSEIQLLSYGNATLYIESAGSVYLIVFLDAEPDHEQRHEINLFFSEIMEDSYGFLQHFNGDDTAPEILSLKEKMYIFLNKDIAKDMIKEKRPFLKYAMVTLGVISIFYLGMLFKEYYRFHTLEKMIMRDMHENITLSVSNDVLFLNGYVHHIENISKIETILHTEGYKKIHNKLFISPIAIDKKVKRLEDEIQALQHILKSEHFQ